MGKVYGTSVAYAVVLIFFCFSNGGGEKENVEKFKGEGCLIVVFVVFFSLFFGLIRKKKENKKKRKENELLSG